MERKAELVAELEAEFSRWEELLNGLGEGQVSAAALVEGMAVKDVLALTVYMPGSRCRALAGSGDEGERVGPGKGAGGEREVKLAAGLPARRSAGGVVGAPQGAQGGISAGVRAKLGLELQYKETTLGFSPDGSRRTGNEGWVGSCDGIGFVKDLLFHVDWGVFLNWNRCNRGFSNRLC